MAHPDIISLYLEQFLSPPPAEIVTSTSQNEVIYAFCGLWFAVGPTSSPDHFNDIVEMLFPVWPQFWKWMDFLYREIDPMLKRKIIHNQFASLISMALQNVFLRLCQHSYTATTVAATEGTLNLAVYMYVDLGKRPPNDEDAPMRLKSAGDIVSILLQSPLSDFTEVIQVVGFKKSEAARALFLPVTLCTRSGDVWAAFFPPVINVHIKLCERNPTFYRSLPQNIVLSHICDALSYFTSSRSHFPHHIEHILELLNKYSSNASDGHSWFIYALRRKILPSIFQSAAPNGLLGIGRNIGPCVQLFLNDLRLHSIHHPILQRLSRAPQLRQRHPPTGIYGKVLSEWTRLTQGIAYAQTAWAEFDALPGYSLACFYQKVVICLPVFYVQISE
ncbi:hypothetical protein DXG01_005819 [Tephrocybe rancida]|nr:hypothetical protein DXG01_005819 [Tephrocybe rancida]